mgnify:CR=1 FL=1
MGKEEGQHIKYISCSYIACMCGFEHVNWSGKIEFSQGKLNLVREKSGKLVLPSLWEMCYRNIIMFFLWQWSILMFIVSTGISFRFCDSTGI